MKKLNRKERILLYKVAHKLLCPQCEGKTARQLFSFQSLLRLGKEVVW